MMGLLKVSSSASESRRCVRACVRAFVRRNQIIGWYCVADVVQAGRQAIRQSGGLAAGHAAKQLAVF